MSRAERRIAEFRDCRGAYKYDELLKVLASLGYEPLKAGKTSGSRRAFINRAQGNHKLFLHERHDGVMPQSMVRRIQRSLREVGLL